eukprot:g1627.t1
MSNLEGRGPIASDHWQTMSLRTVENQKKTKRRAFHRPPNNPRVTNDVSDIPGCKPSLGAYRFTNKPSFHNTDDIDGAQPRSRYSRFKSDRVTNDVSDIPGAKPMPHGFRTNRVTDPLNPVYSMPRVEMRKQTPPRFLGDRFNNDDIEGSKPKKLCKWKPRDSMNVHDIEGAQTGWRPRHKQINKPRRNYMDVKDINGGGFKSKRVTCPLDPVHTIYGETFGTDPKSKPRGLPKRRNGPDLMQTTDIPGASAAWRKKQKRPLRQIRQINRTDDIRGAQADTNTQGIRTKRCTDPLNPNYKGLDGSLLGTYDRPQTPDAKFNTFFKSMDLDGDGKISADEFIAALDRDGDGQVSLEEMNLAMQSAIRKTSSEVQRDPRDDEIEKLKAEIESLRSMQAQYGTNRGNSSKRNGGLHTKQSRYNGTPRSGGGSYYVPLSDRSTLSSARSSAARINSTRSRRLAKELEAEKEAVRNLI